MQLHELEIEQCNFINHVFQHILITLNWCITHQGGRGHITVNMHYIYSKRGNKWIHWEMLWSSVSSTGG